MYYYHDMRIRLLRWAWARCYIVADESNCNQCPQVFMNNKGDVMLAKGKKVEYAKIPKVYLVGRRNQQLTRIMSAKKELEVVNYSLKHKKGPQMPHKNIPPWLSNSPLRPVPIPIARALTWPSRPATCAAPPPHRPPRHAGAAAISDSARRADDRRRRCR